MENDIRDVKSMPIASEKIEIRSDAKLWEIAVI